jgi:hypothetical protein
MLSSGRQSAGGPRSIERIQQCRDKAQTIMQKEREEILRRQNDSPNEIPEPSATAANHCAVKRLFKPSALDVTSKKDLKELMDEHMKRKEAVTYWSHKLMSGDKPHFPVTSLMPSLPLFARCASFSNDIEDSRVLHSEDKISDK